MSSIIVDTSVWSLALRKKILDETEQRIVTMLSDYIRGSKVVMLGAIRQEILSGISNLSRYERLRDIMRFFPDFSLTEADYERAASYFNLCRSHGIQGSHTDFLLCSVATSNDFAIFSLDDDFQQYQKFIRFELIR